MSSFIFTAAASVFLLRIADSSYTNAVNFMRGFDAEWKLLRRPTENGIPNLAPLWPNGNLSTDSSHAVVTGILKHNVNVAICFNFCVNIRQIYASNTPGLERKRVRFRKFGESNQTMKPTAPLRCKFIVFATTPCRGLSLSR